MLWTGLGLCFHQLWEKKEPQSWHSCLVTPKFQEDDVTHNLGFQRQMSSQIWSLFWFLQLSPGHLQLVSSSSSLSSVPILITDTTIHLPPGTESFMTLTNAYGGPTSRYSGVSKEQRQTKHLSSWDSYSTSRNRAFLIYSASYICFILVLFSS